MLQNQSIRFIAIIVVLFVLQGGYLVYQNHKLQGTVEGINTQEKQNLTPNLMPMNHNMAQMPQEQPQANMPIPTPTIFVEGEEELTEEERNELYKKVITPYIDLYREDRSDRVGLLTLSLMKETDPEVAETRPYMLCSSFQNGRNECIGVSRIDGTFSWYQPECGVVCNFPPFFSTKYPEIVKNYQEPLINSGSGF
jgi:hypothetical protein